MRSMRYGSPETIDLLITKYVVKVFIIFNFYTGVHLENGLNPEKLISGYVVLGRFLLQTLFSQLIHLF